MRSPALAGALVLLLLPAGQLHVQRVQLMTPLDSLVRRAERDSNDAPAHYEVALGYWVHRKYDLAERHLRLAVAANPRSHRALYLLGRISRQAGNAAEARSAWTRFLALAPSRWDTQRQEVQQQLAQLPQEPS